MPPPNSPDIAVKCYYGDAKGVADAIAAGADLLEVACPAVLRGSVGRRRGQPDPECGIALHYACFYAHIDCVRELLATGCHEQLDWRRAETGATPLVLLCQHAGQAACSVNPHQLADTLTCVELLLEAGAALEPRTTKEHTNPRPVGEPSAEARRGRVREDPSLPRDWRVSPSGLTALDFAYLSGDGDLVRALEDAAGLRYSPPTHRRFPRPARYAAAGWLRLGYRVGSGALLPVWASRVLPFLVARTSRAPAPRLAAAATRAPSEAFAVGATVRVVGLAKATQHNGKLGRVCRKAGPEGRVGVALDLGGAVAVRRENLEALDASDDEASASEADTAPDEDGDSEADTAPDEDGDSEADAAPDEDGAPEDPPRRASGKSTASRSGSSDAAGASARASSPRLRSGGSRAQWVLADAQGASNAIDAMKPSGSSGPMPAATALVSASKRGCQASRSAASRSGPTRAPTRTRKSSPARHARALPLSSTGARTTRTNAPSTSRWYWRPSKTTATSCHASSLTTTSQSTQPTQPMS